MNKGLGNNKRLLILICGIICCLIMGFCYIYSIIQPYVMDYFSISSAAASMPYTVFLAVFVAGNYAGGSMQKKHGVRMILLTGYHIMTAGIFLTALLPKSMPAGMWFTYGVLLGLGDGIVYNVIISVVQKWFPDKKGLATGITLATLGISATVLSPLCSNWLACFGFSGVFRILACVYGAIGIFGIFTIKAPPENYMSDYKPSGLGAVSAYQCATAKECFSTKEYYILTLIYFCTVPAFVLLSSIFVSYGASMGLEPGLAVAGVSVASLVQVAGRFLISAGSDKTGRKGAMIACFAFSMVAVVLLTFSKGLLYVVCFWLLSFTYGGTAATMPSLITDYLGTKDTGLVVSLAMLGFGISSIGTSFVASAVSVSTSFIIAGAVAAVGIIATLRLPEPCKGKK